MTMSTLHNDSSGTPPDTPDEITGTLEALKLKKLEIQREIAYLTRENGQYRSRYESLNQKFSSLAGFWERSATVLSQLCDSSKNALQTTRTNFDSPVIVKRRSLVSRNARNQSTTPKPPTNGFNREVVQRLDLHIEPLNMPDLQQENAKSSDNFHEEEQLEDSGATDRSCLSPILEEDSRSKTVKELYIQVARLPNSVVDSYSREHYLNSHLSESSLNSIDISTDPTFSSTPLKLETMKTIQKNNFVSVRQKENKKMKMSPKKEVKVSPKKEKVTPESKSKKRNISSPKSPLKMKKPKLSPQGSMSLRNKSGTIPAGNSRPQRKAKPKLLKEDNLKTKKRRD
ncbi:uncharacterized protein LOC123004177 isoform X2 [Tribolium madens]|uniref:uncharacterized protein LOC123004177 isoform X2 n=1 Tax=Tribolium madens TaxID=41895 RepID=UPI001CF73723|nr:uncharacterized protein LOC123004177 isoform X2 [Tribolium madens]